MSKQPNINIRNKKASHDYEFIDKYVAGIVLTGTEIKSIRLGKANLVDSFCYFTNNELWAKGIHISEYAWGSYNNHVPNRERKLLLNRRELNKINTKLTDKGITVVVTRIFLNDRGFAKAEIAVARGKKQYDKRNDLKEKAIKKDIERIKKHF